ncbi:MAG: CPBP family intramembrane glutamic endopeptidase [Clostridiaceae bacterium]|nr:CPBP family intramembrane glutamic endopeptidase [Clostridiaceae bacterium]
MNKAVQIRQQPKIRMPSGVPGLPQPPEPVYRGVAGTALLVHTLLYLFFMVLKQFWPPLANLVGGDSLKAFVAGGILVQGGLILIPAVVILILFPIPPADLIGAKANAGSLILAVTAGIPAAVIFQGLNNLLIYVLVRSGVNLPQPAAVVGPAGSDLLRQPWPVLLLILVISIIMPGLVEELFFRGILLSSLSSSGAFAAALIAQALAFALFHADMLFILPPFLAGLLLGYIRRQCGSLWPAMLTHMSLNLSLIAINPLLPRITAQYMTGSAQQTTSLLYASLIAACIAAVAFVPLLVLIGSLRPHPPHTPPQQARRRFWPGDWKFALAIVLQIVTLVLLSL